MGEGNSMQRPVNWCDCNLQLWRTGLEGMLRILRWVMEWSRFMLSAGVTRFRFPLVSLFYRLQLLLLRPAFKVVRVVSSSETLLVATSALLSVVPGLLGAALIQLGAVSSWKGLLLLHCFKPPVLLQKWLDPGNDCSVDEALLREGLLVLQSQSPISTVVAVIATEGQRPIPSRRANSWMRAVQALNRTLFLRLALPSSLSAARRINPALMPTFRSYSSRKLRMVKVVRAVRRSSQVKAWKATRRDQRGLSSKIPIALRLKRRRPPRRTLLKTGTPSPLQKNERIMDGAELSRRSRRTNLHWFNLSSSIIVQVLFRFYVYVYVSLVYVSVYVCSSYVSLVYVYVYVCSGYVYNSFDAPARDALLCSGAPARDVFVWYGYTVILRCPVKVVLSGRAAPARAGLVLRNHGPKSHSRPWAI